MVLIGICAVLTASSVSAASTVYVNATGGNDSNTGTIDHPYQTIQKGIISIEENGTVQLADGVYSGTGNTNITIDKNMIIQGLSQNGTIINGTDTNWIFSITSGVNVTILNLTFTNGIAYDGGAILNHGILSISDCTFTENTATNWGGAIFNNGVLSISDCTLTENTALHGGGAIAYLSICNITNCTFMYNSVTGATSWCGGAIGAYRGSNSTVTGCTFVGNSVDLVSTSFGGGAIYVYDATLTANFNRFYNNSARLGNAFAFNTDSNVLINAENNWWGFNVDPTTVPNLIYGPVDANPWVILTVNATPSTINNGETSAITADFNHINGGGDLVGGHIPDGTPVTYSSTLGNFNPVTSTTVNGIATTLFTANHIGTGYLYATTDDQTVSRGLTVNQGPTVTTVGGVSGYAGQNVTLTAYVDCYGAPVNEGTVTFTVDGTTLTPVTVTNGLATLNWTIPTIWAAGNYTIVADYSGSSNYLASTNGTNLTVTPNPTTITVGGVSGFAGQNVTLTANLADSNGNPVKDGQVTFRVNNTNIGTVDVSNGVATLQWTIPTNWTAGNYGVVAEYSGSSNYLASTNSTLLTLQPSSYLYLNTTTSKKNPTVGETFILTYKLSNSGPDNATNVTVSFQIPAGLEFVSASVDNGTVTYNPANRTVTWNLTNVEVGDPYLYLTVRALGTGSYSITPTITSETFNQNNDPITPFTVNVQAQNNSNGNTVNAASKTKTVPMQKTGMPIAGLVLAILAVLGGTLVPRKK
ncbi:beta strand repeat-containing protein [Methanobacterium aggregans]|uniref:beta strand repeat-containing protein n=1 Tax=Methanobacterium aggregans TaxID=1615586 RepID=UPI001AE27871|nr:Ig-like domain repeat protein [Methanobacterium aggregans]MBP2045281.1 putative repeat protein (TIGR01451 family) [Methanobacterium aggregans]